jgi:hypothetical protein
MKMKTFFRVIVKTGDLECMPFTAEHYKEAGALLTPDFGLHEMNALALVNKWNRNNGIKPAYVYFI